jgi:hypothetical protein
MNEKRGLYICVTNNYSATVRFKVTTNAPRLTVSESTITTLTANQSIVLTVHLCVKHQGEVDRANDDYVRFRSDFHDFQQVKVGYSISQLFACQMKIAAAKLSIKLYMTVTNNYSATVRFKVTTIASRLTV